VASSFTGASGSVIGAPTPDSIGRCLFHVLAPLIPQPKVQTSSTMDQSHPNTANPKNPAEVGRT
jgi:hypothetical protein